MAAAVDKYIHADNTIKQSSSALAVERRKKNSRCSIFDYAAVMELFKINSIKEFHAFTIWRYIVQRGCTSFSDIPNIPKAACTLLEKHFSLSTTKVLQEQTSRDYSTTKLLISLQDGKRIETVIMRYGQVELETFPQHLVSSPETSTSPELQHPRKYKSGPRTTVCVSSQVGCAMGCRFCATGTMGLLSNLTSGEIIEQLIAVSRIEPIRNVVFMGMGEPLDNYYEVLDAIKLMTDPRIFKLSAHHISLSTVGVVPRIKQLKKDAPDISLALSLHAPTQELRERIVPSAKAWHINSILDAVTEFVVFQKLRTRTHYKNQGVLLEYVLIRNVNASSQIATLLGELLSPQASLFQLNVIPYNPSKIDSIMESPTQQEIDSFVAIVRSYNIKVTVRQTLGQDISAACGQLAINSISEENQDDVHDVTTTSTTDVEEIVVNSKKRHDEVILKKNEQDEEDTCETSDSCSVPENPDNNLIQVKKNQTKWNLPITAAALTALGFTTALLAIVYIKHKRRQ